MYDRLAGSAPGVAHTNSMSPPSIPPQEYPLEVPLTRGYRVSITALCEPRRSTSVNFIEQEGLIVCSVYNYCIHTLKKTSDKFSSNASSAGVVVRQMLDAGIDLQPRITTLLKQLQKGEIDCSNPKLEPLWQRSEMTPAGVKCDAIVLALLPKAWSVCQQQLDLEEESQEQEMRDGAIMLLQNLYADIRAVIAQHEYKAVCMPSIGSSELFPINVAMREVAALASHCEDVIPSVQKIVICTNRLETLQGYQAMFDTPGSEWWGIMSEFRINESCKQLRQLLQQVPSEHFLGPIVDDINSIIDSVRRQSLGHCLDILGVQAIDQLHSINTNKYVTWMLKINSDISPSESPRSSTQLAASDYHHDVASHCCIKGRVVVEGYLKQIISLPANKEVCERQWHILQRGSPRRCDPSKAMVGELLTVVRGACKKLHKQGNAAGLHMWSQELDDACSALQHAGNQASHRTEAGRVTVADANVALWHLKQLVEALLGVTDGTTHSVDAVDITAASGPASSTDEPGVSPQQQANISAAVAAAPAAPRKSASSAGCSSSGRGATVVNSKAVATAAIEEQERADEAGHADSAVVASHNPATAAAVTTDAVSKRPALSKGLAKAAGAPVASIKGDSQNSKAACASKAVNKPAPVSTSQNQRVVGMSLAADASGSKTRSPEVTLKVRCDKHTGSTTQDTCLSSAAAAAAMAGDTDKIRCQQGSKERSAAKKSKPGNRADKSTNCQGATYGAASKDASVRQGQNNC